MKFERYNKAKIKEAIDYIKKNPLIAKELFEDYIEKYPKDYNGRIFYIKVLITLNKIDEAISYMNNLLDEVNSDKQYLNSDKYKIFASTIFINMVQILAIQKKYEKIYSLFQENINWFNGHPHDSLLFLCNIKLGKKIDMSSLSYIKEQMIDYKEESLLDHLNKHLPEGNIDKSEPNKNIFSPFFDLKRVIQEIKKYIPSEDKYISTAISDYYIFKYNDCGRDNGKITNYFKVVCFHDTNQIITMLPISNTYGIPSIDLNHMIENTPSNNEDQIKKFYKKWAMSHTRQRKI